MGREDVKNRRKLATLQVILQRQTTSVIKQIIIAYVIYCPSLCGTLKNKLFLKTDNVFNPAVGDLDSYDLRQNSSSLFPPEYYVKFLHQASIQSVIGAEVRYQECPDPPYNLFVKTGDVCLHHL